MALRSWSRVLLTALAVAMTAGAGQLGLAYGLGIVRFARSFLDAAEAQWPGQLAWVAWFAMLAAVIGALAADRMAGRHGGVLSLGGRAAVSAAAALGAAVVAPLTMQPARAAQITPAVDPVLTVGLTAVMGAVVGGLVAAAVLILRPVRWNVVAVSGAVWGLALLSVFPSLGPRDPLPTVRLGVLDLPSLAPGTTRALALIGIPALALLAGAATAGLARWLGHQRLIVMVACGAAGPGLLALAYVLAGPGGSAQQAAPYWAALISLAAGLLGSVLLTVVPAPGSAGSADSPADADFPAGTGAPGDAPSPADAAASGGVPAASTVAQLWPNGDPFSSTSVQRKSGRAEPTSAESTSTDPTSTDRTSTAPGADGTRGPEPALVDPTPDPLTAPLEQLKLGRRPRPRPKRSPAAQASSPPPAAPPPPQSPPVVPEPALKELPAEALPPADAPPDPPAQGGWLSMRRQRRTAVDARPADEPPKADKPTKDDKSAKAVKPTKADKPTNAGEGPAPEADAEQPRRSKLGRLRRGERATPEQRRPPVEEKLAAGDEEYVDWVSGLGGNRKRDKI